MLWAKFGLLNIECRQIIADDIFTSRSSATTTIGNRYAIITTIVNIYILCIVAIAPSVGVAAICGKEAVEPSQNSAGPVISAVGKVCSVMLTLAVAVQVFSLVTVTV